MAQTAQRNYRGHLKVTTDDVIVGCAALCALTYKAWGWMLESIPHVMQGIIVTATVVYVVARAAIEVRKLIKGEKKNDS